MNDIFIIAFTILTSANLVYANSADRVENGWYDSNYPVPVMHLEGSIEDVARAHGQIVSRHPEGRDVLMHYANALGTRIESNPLFNRWPILKGIADFSYTYLVRKLLIDHTPDRYRDAYSYFSKAAGIPEDKVWDALVLPDASLRILTFLYDTEAAPAFASSLGCTSVIWDSGHSWVLHGRNLDYEGVGLWDKHQVVMHVIPQEGLAYVAITALGMHAPGITAFNEAGLTLAVHQLTLRDTQSSGTPMPIISAEVIRSARTIEDAIAIIRNFPRSGGWAYVVSQGHDRAVIETSANEVAIRRSSEPFFFQTNHVASPALASQQYFYSPGSWIDTFSRAEKLEKLRQSELSHGWATPEKLGPVLGLGSPERPEYQRVAGGLISKLDNIQSVMMDAGHRRLWIAVSTNSQAPNQNNYIEYRWSDLRSADPPEVTGAEVSILPQELLGEKGARLRELLHEALAETKMQTRLDHLQEYVRNAVENNEPVKGSWPGVYLHIWQNLQANELSAANLNQWLSELDVAMRDADLSQSQNRSSSPLSKQARTHRLMLGRLLRGHLLDLLGRRSEALFEYMIVKRSEGFERLHLAAESGLKRSYTQDQARALAIDWPGLDLYRY